jgi:NhaA family Na+:H+ antiporter
MSVRARHSYLARALRSPVQTYILTEQVGAIVLLLAAVVAMVWVNSPWEDSYHDLWDTLITLDVGLFAVSEDLGHWVNDGLMTIFFFVVGLEIKRELLHGELSTPRRAALPVVAAAGGMLLPALLYLAINRGGEGADGWGIPMATDIAFALGVLGLVGRRVPADLRVFLLALAVADDLGAILVIAVFYTESLDVAKLGIAGGLLIGVLAANLIGIRSITMYWVLGALVWVSMLQSGVHATLTGVLLAAITPAAPYFSREGFRRESEVLFGQYITALEAGNSDQAEVLLGQMEELSQGTESPLERLERFIHPWSSFLVLPIFALANAGISLSGDALESAWSSDVTIGVFIGLVAGKALGIFGFTWLAVRSGLATLPRTVSWPQLLGVSLLAGIGFTVAIFIAGLAFDAPGMTEHAKTGIFLASLVAGVLGFLALRMAGRERRDAEAG